ncbi:hypothetical protein Cgig2_020522 [Carnegiea gigantea]|uniref:Gnk2-homologous domain-containing protein n=1 Tax=Carnegiea gigantea TaxID=171969 RepID=A0A9Q1KBS3_9CARY|nr:hypothetical protein Cgig2_020522 [Carnegiea gigantea]
MQSNVINAGSTDCPLSPRWWYCGIAYDLWGFVHFVPQEGGAVEARKVIDAIVHPTIWRISLCKLFPEQESRAAETCCFQKTFSLPHFFVVMKLIIVLFFIFLLCDHVSPQHKFFSSFFIEKSGLYTANSLYDNNLSLLLFNLTSAASARGFYNSTAGEGPDKVYGIFYCRGDLKSEDGHHCVQTASQESEMTAQIIKKPSFFTMNVYYSMPIDQSSLSKRKSLMTGKRKLKIAVGAVVFAALGLILFLSGVWFWLHRRKRSKGYKGSY